MQNLYRSAALVTVFSAIEHCLGFLYRIILSRILGSVGLGVYQVALTMFAVFLTVTASGLPVTLSRTIAKYRTRRNRRGEGAATAAAICIALAFSLGILVLLFLFRGSFSRVFTDPDAADLFYIFLLGLPFTSVYAVLRGNFWGNKRFLPYSVIELIEEIVMIATGVFLLVGISSDIPAGKLAAVAVLVSYLCSFAIATGSFFARGEKLCSPKREFLPLLKSSLPVTAMRTSSSLVNSLVSVLFPLRLTAAGESSAAAMSAYGVVCGMVMPVLMIPSTLIGSIALVLVPDLSEAYYRGDRAALSALVEKALNAALLIAACLIPFFLVCGKDVGLLLYSNASSGELIAKSAPILLPMCLTMICGSLLNSMNCEKQTLCFFLLGAAAMLVCVCVLPRFLSGGALLAGMGCDYAVSAVCSLVLLKKKTGSLRSGRYFLRLVLACLPVIAVGSIARKFFMLFFGEIPALALSLLVVGIAELVLFSVAKVFSLSTLFRRFFGKNSKKMPARP